MVLGDDRRPEMPPYVACALSAARSAWGAVPDVSGTGHDGARALGRQDRRALVQYSVDHGIEGLVWAGLKGRAGDREEYGELEDRFTASAAGALRLASECIRIVDAARSEGVPMLPWKGPTLAAAAYGNVAVRPCGDLDFVLTRSDLSRGEAVLAGLGYRRAPSRPSKTSAWMRLREYNVVFYRRSDGLVVELHYAWTPMLFLGTAGGMSGRVEDVPTSEYDVCGTRVPSLAPAALLETLVVHGVKHGWERLIWLADVAGLLARNEDLASQLASRFAEGSTLERFALFTLGLAREVFGTALPRHVAARIGQRGLSALVAEQAERLTHRAGPERTRRRLYPTGVNLGTSRLYMRLYGSQTERLRYCASAGRLWLGEKMGRVLAGQ